MPGKAGKTMSTRTAFAIALALMLLALCAPYATATTETVTYSYDNTYQLTGATYNGRAADVTYAYDDFGNMTSVTTTTTDATPPASAITYPEDGAFLNGSTITVTGTASDTGIGVKGVDLVVSPEGFSNVSSVYPAFDTSGGSWSTWGCNWTLPDDGDYVLKSRAVDNANNVETPGTGVSVTVDNTAPSSSITYPADGAKLQDPDITVTGTADDGTGSGVDTVEVLLNGQSAGFANYSSGSWSYDWSVMADGVYNVQSRATDVAGNVEEPSGGRYVTVIKDTDGGGISDAVENAKGGNPNNSSDDMGLIADKYCAWFSDNDGNSTSTYIIRNDGNEEEVVDVSFEEWAGVSQNPRAHIEPFIVPAHGYLKFMPRDYTMQNNTSIQYGSSSIWSENEDISGYNECDKDNTALADGAASAFSLQDYFTASSTALYVPFINDGEDNSGSRLGVVIKNLDRTQTSTGTLEFKQWPDNGTPWSTSSDIGANVTYFFRPSWLSGYPYTYSSMKCVRTNGSKVLGIAEGNDSTQYSRDAYPLPAYGEDTLYLPWYMDRVDDGYNYASADDRWQTYIEIKSTEGQTTYGTAEYYSPGGNLLYSQQVGYPADFGYLERPTWTYSSASTGWMKVSFPSGSIVGAAIYPYFYGNGTSDAILLSGKTSNRLILPRFRDDDSSGVTTKVRILNTSDSQIYVYADYYDQDGTEVGSTAQITIGAMSVADFRPSDYNSQLTEGSIEFSTDLPVITGMWQTITDEEPFTDSNSNNKWDTGESYTDTNSNGLYDPRTACSESLTIPMTDGISTAITEPSDNATLSGSSYTITGTADGSGVDSVYVGITPITTSVGQTEWHLASGTGAWSYSWSLPSNGTYKIESVAVDDTGRLEPHGPAVTVTVQN
jgi:YD repeat-containing protein